MIKTIFNIPGSLKYSKEYNMEPFELPIIELPFRLIIGDYVNMETILEGNDYFHKHLTEEQADICYRLDSTTVYMVELRFIDGEYIMYYQLSE